MGNKQRSVSPVAKGSSPMHRQRLQLLKKGSFPIKRMQCAESAADKVHDAVRSVNGGWSYGAGLGAPTKTNSRTILTCL